MQNVRKNATRLLKIPGMLLICIFLAGCLQTTSPMPIQPTKPTLEVQTNPADPQGICLDRDNTYLLLDYIWRLEEGYQ